MRYRHIVILIILTFGICQSLEAQKSNELTLTTILNTLSDNYGIKISFSPSMTDTVYLTKVETRGTAEEALKQVLSSTMFSFRLVNGTYYYIYKDTNKTPPRVTVEKVVKEVEQEPTIDTIFYHDLVMNITDEVASKPPKHPIDVDTSALALMPYRYQQPEMEMPKFAVKTNLLYDATATINLGIEIGLNKRVTLDLSGNYNNWTYSNNRKMKHLMLQPELRMWECERFNGGFVGIHAFAGAYNWGGMLPWGFNSGKMFGEIENSTILQHRFDGWVVGGGIGYGHHWILNNRFSVEAQIGLGYAYLEYDKYRCERCGDILDRENAHYFGPTKAAISLIFIP